MQRLHYRGLTTDLNFLDNEASRDYTSTVKDKWGVDFQLLPPDIRRISLSEQAIHTLNAHFLAILSGVAP